MSVREEAARAALAKGKRKPERKLSRLTAVGSYVAGVGSATCSALMPAPGVKRVSQSNIRCI